MPELPEVETIRRGLEKTIIGLKFTAVKSLHPKSLQANDDELKANVIGAGIISLHRYGKVMEIRLETGFSLLFHLKMTGQVVLVGPEGQRYAGGHPTRSMTDALPDRSSKVVFELNDGSTMYFNDQRIFGWVKLEPTSEVMRDGLIARMGPEPMTEAFELPKFAAILKRRGRSPIKAVILDQSTVAGVGNIYADESLHLAKVHPAALAGDLKDREVQQLYEAIKTIIALGIKHGGTSFTNYVNALGGKGDYLQHARVFRRQGMDCPVCGCEIIKTRVAGRGTHLCPHCQKPPKL